MPARTRVSLVGRHQPLALDAGPRITPLARDDGIRHSGCCMAAEIVPAHIPCAPPSIRARVVAVPRPEVEHLPKGALLNDSNNIRIRSKDAAAAIHTQQPSMVARVNSSRPVLIDTRSAVAMRASSTASQNRRGHMLAANITQDVRQVGGRGCRRRGRRQRRRSRGRGRCRWGQDDRKRRGDQWRDRAHGLGGGRRGRDGQVRGGAGVTREEGRAAGGRGRGGARGDTR